MGKKKKEKESITLNQKRYREGVRDVKLYIYIYIYPKLLEEVDMKKINLKKSVKSKRIWNSSSQEVNMAKKKKKKSP